MSAILEAAADLYRALRNMPCSCVTKWEHNDRALVTECRRCLAVGQWEALRGLPASPRGANVFAKSGAAA